MRISAEHPALNCLNEWLEAQKTFNKKSPPYCHCLFIQKKPIDLKIQNELYEYVNHAHEGARQSLRAPLGDSLHPLHHGSIIDPASEYPHKLSEKALQGCFGEIIAGIIAEHYVGEGARKWEVPVFLFRTHVIAFQQLEKMKQTNEWDYEILGRTGDDGLAFIRNKDGEISAWLACEAKCTKNHSSTLINSNHEKLSNAVTHPVDLLRMIDALQDYQDDDYARNWIRALKVFWMESSSGTVIPRSDLSVYICGAVPKKKKTWIPTDKPHHMYKGKRELISTELHLPKVDEIIRSLYQRMQG